jgi:phenylacetic acid degradation operon negative regulatory protein
VTARRGTSSGPVRLDRQIASLVRRRPLRAGSLLVTVFGDAISQHGNLVWLGSLIRALEPLGLNARQLRTAAFRLAREGWLSASQRGRRSFYSLTDHGLRQYARAARRVYAAERPPWDGMWTLVIAAGVTSTARSMLRRELLWQGYGQLAPGVFAHPNGDRTLLDEVLREQGVADRVVVLRTGAVEPRAGAMLAALSREHWGLDHAARRYRDFLRLFEPVLAASSGASRPTPEQAFLLRTLLIHEYRRIVLHDADLPDELLPGDWPGYRAAELTARLYRALHPEALRFLTREMVGAEGPLPPPGLEYARRFGGLD